MPLEESTWWRLPTWPEVAYGAAVFVVLAAVSALLTGFVVVWLPADYFVGPHPPPFWDGRHPVLRVAAKVVKNLMGAVFVIGGTVMLFTPGQGVLTILLGVMLLDIPGKRQIERRLVGRPGVLRVINRLRARYGRPPLEIRE